MPCFFTECNTANELKRFLVCSMGIYLYHYCWNRFMIGPFTSFLVRKKYLSVKKSDRFRESSWKNVAVLSFLFMGLYIAFDETWFLSRNEYWKNWPYVSKESLRWYYMIYAAFWIQSIDFLLSLSGKYYDVKRKDSLQMLIHHITTLILMLFSYVMDFTKIGICVLMIHDVNDILLETAKLFVYMDYKLIADILFAIFAIAWYLLRWGYFSCNIIHSVYYNAYNEVYLNIKDMDLLAGFSASFWYYVWLGYFLFLCLLLILHIYWGILIGKMAIKALYAGRVEKDIRSDSEDEDNEEVAKTNNTRKSKEN